MSRRSLILAAAATAVALAGCSQRRLKTNDDVKAALSGNAALPYRVVTLSNGLKVFFIKDETLPRVSMALNVLAGPTHEPPSMGGLASLTGALIDEGTATRSAVQISDAFNALGTEFTANTGYDSVNFAASALTPDADRLLENYADVILNPAFSEKELTRAKGQYTAAIRKIADDPSRFASREFGPQLYGESPYGRSSWGTLDSISKIRRTDVIRYYLAFYRPNNSALAVVGRYDGEFEKKVVAAFERWSAREIKPTEYPAPPAPGPLKVRLVSKTGLAQTQIRLGRIAVTRGDPDYVPLMLATNAFGADFGSRLMQKVRDELGLTYSISAELQGHKAAGDLEIATFTRNDKVKQTLDETLKLYRAFVDGGITAEELESAKAQFVGQYPRSIETADGIASYLLALNSMGLPLSVMTDLPAQVRAVTLRQVNEAVKKHFGEGDLTVLVYGDEDVVGPQVK